MSITPIVDSKKHEVRWTLGLATYPMDAIYGASYVFVDRCFVYLDKTAPKSVEVVLQGKEPLDKDALGRLAGEFANELLHQVLRITLAKRTGTVREMIVGRALFSAKGGEDAYGFEDDLDDWGEDGDADYLDDPLGIAVPWEEKYGTDDEMSVGSAASAGGVGSLGDAGSPGSVLKENAEGAGTEDADAPPLALDGSAPEKKNG